MPENHPELGYDIPAIVGMAEEDVLTPCLILDLDRLERNILKMGEFISNNGIAHRAHGKMHKSVDVAKLQISLGGACGVCCQKVSEAEAFARGGISDILISNQVTDLFKVNRLANLPKLGARVLVCVDNLGNITDLSDAAQSHETQIECLVEIDCGANRCGLTEIDEIVVLAKAIDQSPGLTFSGVQAYQGEMQHFALYEERHAAVAKVVEQVALTTDALSKAGLPCAMVTGAGTGSFPFETASGVYTELQCGSYAFMDADYGRILDKDGKRLDENEWENALFVLTSIMSHPTADRAICDAGLKAHAVDSGLPIVFDAPDLNFLKCSDEHGTIADPNNRLSVNQRLRLVPGHCDPTCNLHDWYVGVRNGVVECLWPVSARGKGF